MAHTRIRKFNTKDTYPEQKLDNDLCQAVVARGTTSAEEMLAAYHTRWGDSIEPAFLEYAY